ncbi:MAG: serine hydrolase [Chitinophagaceae bacterium]|nr:serine hydrolase [Chitinophagaceae bacterium]
MPSSMLLSLKKTTLSACFVFIAVTGTTLHAQQFNNLPRGVPENENVYSGQILRFLEEVHNSKNEFHSYMLLRHGKVISEGWWAPYAPSLKHTMYSVSKSFTATAIGFAVTEQRLSLQDKVTGFFTDELPDTVSQFVRDLTVKDLITMSAGQSPDPTGSILKSNQWVKHFLSVPIVDTPGTKFLYNSAATFMLSAIIQKITGERLIDYLTPRLFEPLEITGIDWEENPEGINAGGWGLRLKTEDMAKFGQFFLQKGNWQGKQLLPASWIEEASSFKIKNAPDTAIALKAKSDWAQGYCYQMWRCRNDAYRADGAFGQYIIVMPDQDAVLAITSETADMQNILNLVWTYLLPAFENEPINATATTIAKLEKQNAQLILPAPVFKASRLSKEIAGRTYTLETNDASIHNISFKLQSKRSGYIIVQFNNISDTIYAGRNQWRTSTLHRTSGIPSLTGTMPPAGKNGQHIPLAAAYTWTDKQSLEIKLRYIESPHSEVWRLGFDKNNITLRIDNSLKGMSPGGNDKNPVIKGSY